MAVRRGHQPAVGQQDRPMLEEAQEHRRLHVEDVVVRPVDRRRPHDRRGEAGGGVAVEHRLLGDRLEPAVRAGAVRVRGQVLGPREDAGERLVVGHDRAHVHVVADPAVEQVQELGDVAVAGGHHEAGHVEDGIPGAVTEGRPHRGRVGPVRDEVLDAVRQRRGRLAPVQHRDLCVLRQEGADEPLAHEHRTAEHQRSHRTPRSSCRPCCPGGVCHASPRPLPARAAPRRIRTSSSRRRPVGSSGCGCAWPGGRGTRRRAAPPPAGCRRR